MHSAAVRVQNVFGFFTTVAFFVACVVALSSLTFPQAPSGKLAMRNVQVVRGRPHYYSQKREEYAHIKFDLDMDLSSLYNWNTKQVFVYVVANYPGASASEPPSQAVIWDAILPARSAPWHHNQYLHFKPSPQTGKKPASSRSKVKHNADATPGILKLDGQRPKYQISDPSGRIANTEGCTLELKWNVQPWVGPLWWANSRTWGSWKALKGGRSKRFNMPALKSKDAQAAKPDDLKTMKGGEANKGHPGAII